MITAEEVKEKTIKRLWSKIKFGEPNECWEWQRHRAKFGHGVIKVMVDKKGKSMGAHRFMYESIFGKTELDVCHTCDNPPCCNPNHLWAGTQADNNRDRDMKGRQRTSIGVNRPAAKLNEEKVIEIKNRLATGTEKQKHIANEFGVDQTIIYRIKIGTAWKHVQI